MAGRSPSSLVSAARLRVSRGILRLLGPRIDATAAEGGLGAHPLGERRAPWWGELTADDQTLLDAALLAESDPTAATARLESWLSSDTPGEGARWSALDSVACRLIHLAAIHAWVNLPESTAKQLAGSARAHGAWLFREHASEPGDPDVALAHAALVIAGLAWPALESARSFRGPGLGGLSSSLADATGEDGPGSADPTRLARAAWAAALTRAWLEASGASLPAAADGALIRAATALHRIGGDAGILPEPAAPVSPLLPLGPAPLPHTLHNLLVAWGLHQPPGAAADDPACALLTGAVPAPGAAPMAGADWRMWAWRASGVAVAHRLIRKMPARAWVSAPARRFSLNLDGETVLDADMPAGDLRVARVDGNQATLMVDHSGGTRDIRLRQARVTVADEGLSEVRWRLPAWPREPNDKGFQARAPSGAQLIIKTDPAWRWVCQGDTLVGTGDPGPVKYSFELR